VKRLVATAFLIAPSVAAACPNCVGNERNTTILKLVGAFMLVPFGVFYAVLRTVKRAQRERELPPTARLPHQ
jgi:hypothetical protein